VRLAKKRLEGGKEGEETHDAQEGREKGNSDVVFQKRAKTERGGLLDLGEKRGGKKKTAMDKRKN